MERLVGLCLEPAGRAQRAKAAGRASVRVRPLRDEVVEPRARYAEPASVREDQAGGGPRPGAVGNRSPRLPGPGGRNAEDMSGQPAERAPTKGQPQRPFSAVTTS